MGLKPVTLQPVVPGKGLDLQGMVQGCRGVISTHSGTTNMFLRFTRRLESFGKKFTQNIHKTKFCGGLPVG